MKLGDIYLWETDKAIGHSQRRKFHVYLCDADSWRSEGHAFLFVSSNNYGGDFAIYKTDYDFFDHPVSFVSCGGIVTYTEEDLAGYGNIKLCGRMTAPHLQALFQAVSKSETIAEWQRKIVCNALKRAF